MVQEIVQETVQGEVQEMVRQMAREMAREMEQEVEQKVEQKAEQKVEQKVEQYQQVCFAGWRTSQVSVEPTRAAVADIQLQDLICYHNTCAIGLDPQLLWMKEKVSD